MPQRVKIILDQLVMHKKVFLLPGKIFLVRQEHKVGHSMIEVLTLINLEPTTKTRIHQFV